MQYTKDFNRIEKWITSLENDTGCSFRTISGRVKDGVYLLAIVRGLPGSGKSTIADYICENFECSKVEVDEFMSVTGEYIWPTKKQLRDAHEKCKTNMLNLMRRDGMAVVSNTSINLAAVLAYFKIANTVSTSCKVLIIEPSTEWAQNKFELKRKSLHGVKMGLIKKMAREYFPLKQGIFPLGRRISDSTTVGDK